MQLDLFFNPEYVKNSDISLEELFEAYLLCRANKSDV
ncbi:MAG: hypothetical protein ACJA01_002090 [Saprospiraceae bacterium]|jgi:hypothetical protein